MSAHAAGSTRTPTWDYSALAADYENRAPYHHEFPTRAMQAAGLAPGDRIVDVGAGTGRVAAALAERGCRVDAVEPCAEMASIGRVRTHGMAVAWHQACAERTTLPAGCYAAVAFGSSLNVVDAAAALAEAARLLRPGGALLVLYNHRDLDDPLQQAVQAQIDALVPGFRHGNRRDDASAAIASGGHFQVTTRITLPFRHRTSCSAFVAGFRAHATLVRQAGSRFDSVLEAIDAVARAHCTAGDVLEIPFCTRVWIARP